VSLVPFAGLFSAHLRTGQVIHQGDADVWLLIFRVVVVAFLLFWLVLAVFTFVLLFVFVKLADIAVLVIRVTHIKITSVGGAIQTVEITGPTRVRFRVLLVLILVHIPLVLILVVTVCSCKR
jgi:hypothetical protein